MSSDYDLAAAAFIVVAFFLLSTVVAPALIVREGGIQADEEERCKEECDELIAALDAINDRTISGLAKANFKQLRMFTVIAVNASIRAGENAQNHLLGLQEPDLKSRVRGQAQENGSTQPL